MTFGPRSQSKQQNKEANMAKKKKSAEKQDAWLTPLAQRRQAELEQGGKAEKVGAPSVNGQKSEGGSRKSTGKKKK